MTPSVYQPYGPARRPGGRPATKPAYRVTVHRKMRARWEDLAAKVGVESAQQFYDHIACTPGSPPDVGSCSHLKGAAAKPTEPGFSRTYHYEISGAGRINYQFNNVYTGGADGDPHPVVRILSINHGSH